MTDRQHTEDYHLIVDDGWLTAEVVMARFLLLAAHNMSSDAYEVLLLLCRRMVDLHSGGLYCQFYPDSVDRCLLGMKQGKVSRG